MGLVCMVQHGSPKDTRLVPMTHIAFLVPMKHSGANTFCFQADIWSMINSLVWNIGPAQHNLLRRSCTPWFSGGAMGSK